MLIIRYIYEISESSGEDEERGIHAILAIVIHVLKRRRLVAVRCPGSRLDPGGKCIN